MKNTRDLTLFHTPLTPKYWRLAWGEWHSLRTLCLTAILIAVCAVLDIFFIPIGDASILQIKFTYFAIALCGMVCGPAVAIPAGILIDTLGYLVGGAASGAYFFGYAISTACSCLIFSLFFYRARKITLARAAVSKLLVSGLVNVLLGSLWRQMMAGKGYLYYVTMAGIKNLALFPLEVVILAVFLQKLLPLLKRAKIVPPTVEFRMSRLDIAATVIATVVGIAALVAYVMWKMQ